MDRLFDFFDRHAPKILFAAVVLWLVSLASILVAFMLLARKFW